MSTVSEKTRAAILRDHFSTIGRAGGSATSTAKAEAARENAKKGGRPFRKPKAGTRCSPCRSNGTRRSAVRFRGTKPVCQECFDATKK